MLPILIREARASRIEVLPFDELEQREFIRSRYVLREADLPRLKTYLKDHAEGNPFFAEELLRSLHDVGALGQSDDGWLVGDLRRFRLVRSCGRLSSVVWLAWIQRFARCSRSARSSGRNSPSNSGNR